MNLVLWNPSTRACKKLPRFTGELDMDSSFTYSLFYDKSSDDYKVVGCFDDNWEKLEVMVLVYSLRADQWKRINDINGYNLMSSRAKFADGKLYWIGYRDYQCEAGWDILARDLGEEEFEVLQIPSCVEIGERSSLHVFEGSLHLLCTRVSCADVWKLDGCGVGVEKWTKVVSIPWCLDSRWRHTFTTLLYVLRVGVFVFLNGGSFVVYDAKDCSFRYPEIRNSIESPCNCYTYVESLFSPMG